MNEEWYVFSTVTYEEGIPVGNGHTANSHLIQLRIPDELYRRKVGGESGIRAQGEDGFGRFRVGFHPDLLTSQDRLDLRALGARPVAEGRLAKPSQIERRDLVIAAER